MPLKPHPLNLSVDFFAPANAHARCQARKAIQRCGVDLPGQQSPELAREQDQTRALACSKQPANILNHTTPAAHSTAAACSASRLRDPPWRPRAPRVRVSAGQRPDHLRPRYVPANCTQRVSGAALLGPTRPREEAERSVGSPRTRPRPALAQHVGSQREISTRGCATQWPQPCGFQRHR